MIKKQKKKKPPFYENRIVLFIDFLGFKEIVIKTTSNESELHCLVKAMDRLGEIGDTLFRASKKATQFSDSVVLSYKVEEELSFFKILNEMAFCVIDLANMGYLVRGGITYGELYHTDQRVVGPGMIKAYELESKFAQVPRVIIDEKILEIAIKYRGQENSSEEMAEYVKSFMTRDQDGQYFFDYVSFNSVVAVTGCDRKDYPDYLRRLGELIKKGLAHHELSVRTKYIWLHKHYLAAIECIESSPLNCGFRVNENEISEKILSLPKLISEADQVRREAVDKKMDIVGLV